MVESPPAETSSAPADGDAAAEALAHQAHLQLAADDVPRAARLAVDAIERAPQSVEAMRALANVFLRLERYPLAEILLREALRVAPRDFALRLNLSLLLFRQRRYEEAWPLVSSHLTWRRVKGVPVTATGAMQPWHPRLPPTANVLVWTEDMTETLLFLGLVEEFRSLAARVALAVPARLVALARRSLPGIEVHPHGTDLGPLGTTLGMTHQLAALGLGFALRRTTDGFRETGFRMQPDPALVARLRARHRGDGGPLIGIAWATRNAVAHYKSIDLVRLLTALPPGARAISLQYGDLGAELAALPPALRARLIVDPEIDPLGDLDPFAALIAACDATLTTSGLAAHLAGRLGVPAVVLVPIGLASAWYWHNGDGPSLWYPTAMLVHQHRRGDWDGALARAAPVLAGMVARDG